MSKPIDHDPTTRRRESWAAARGLLAMSTERLVATRAIQEAVKGRETEVLEAMEPLEIIAALGARHWRWRLEVLD